MTDQSLSTEELVEKWRGTALRHNTNWSVALNEACDLIEQLVKESKQWQELSERCGNDNVVLSKLRDKAEAELHASIEERNALTARAEKAELFEKHVLASHLIPVSEAKNKQLRAEERAEVAEAKLAKAIALVNKQADEESLWFCAVTAPEVRVQRALWELHAVLEDTK